MKHRLFIVFALLNMLSWGEALAQEITFSYETFSDKGQTIPYRKAVIAGLGDKASLVIYLHGGTSKGDDNELQMQEPGINAISTWFEAKNRKAIMLVPQCPQDQSWVGTMQERIVRLLQSYIDKGLAAASKVYILGGSMGGTGTWNMLSNHPGFFAAAMPVAGNPTGLDAEAVSQTPIYTVMGTADKIMKLSNVESFLKEMDTYDAEYKIDIEEGWTHEDVCCNSYTDERLNWLFQHTKQSTAGIGDIPNEGSSIVKEVWYSIGGQRLADEPKQSGVYVKTTWYDNGSVASEKIHIAQ